MWQVKRKDFSQSCSYNDWTRIPPEMLSSQICFQSVEFATFFFTCKIEQAQAPNSNSGRCKLLRSMTCVSPVYHFQMPKFRNEEWNGIILLTTSFCLFGSDYNACLWLLHKGPGNSQSENFLSQFLPSVIWLVLYNLLNLAFFSVVLQETDLLRAELKMKNILKSKPLQICF